MECGSHLAMDPLSSDIRRKKLLEERIRHPVKSLYLTNLSDLFLVHHVHTVGKSFKQVLIHSRKVFQNIIVERGLSIEQLFNYDETALYWKLFPTKRLFHPEKKKRGFKTPKDRVAVIPFANASGSIKFPLLSIHKSLDPRCFQNLDKYDSPVEYYAKSTTVSNHGSMINLSRDAEKGLPKRAILLLNNAPSS